jgi:hypothetical protein
MHKLFYLIVAVALCGQASAQGYRPDFDPSKFKGAASGPRNEVLVLGTAHLKGLSETFDPANLRQLNDRLAAWHPAAIAIEAVSGPQCDFMRHYPGRYKDSIPSWCPDLAAAQAATGLDVPAATDEAEKLLAAWPASPTASQRRHLAALFLAGGERASAVVQWLRLDPAERHAGDGLDDALVASLQKLENRRDESILVAARVAARLGHERVYAMDDHTADSTSDPALDAAYNAAISKAWDNPATHKRQDADKELHKHIDTPEGVLALYRATNTPGQGKLAFDSDFGAALKDPSPQRFGRGYVGYWETRNLRMAANIRDVMGLQPGIRMLVIVGASHKAYLEAYLNQMHDVQVVDAMKVLR